MGALCSDDTLQDGHAPFCTKPVRAIAVDSTRGRARVSIAFSAQHDLCAVHQEARCDPRSCPAPAPRPGPSLRQVTRAKTEPRRLSLSKRENPTVFKKRAAEHFYKWTRQAPRLFNCPDAHERHRDPRRPARSSRPVTLRPHAPTCTRGSSGPRGTELCGCGWHPGQDRGSQGPGLRARGKSRDAAHCTEHALLLRFQVAENKSSRSSSQGKTP